MRVALVIGANLWTGSGVTYSRLARRLSSRGHDVTIVAHDRHMAALFREHGASAVARRRWIRELSLAMAFARLRPDAIVADMKADVLESVRARGRARVPIFYRYNVLDRLLLASPRKRPVILGADALIFQNKALEQKVRTGLPWLAPVPGRVIYAGYELSEFEVDAQARATFRQRHGVPDDALLVLGNAELNPTKGSDLVVRAVAAVAARSARPVRLVMLGRGELPWISQVAAEVGLPVQLPGNVSRGEVLAGCAAADVVVHPSREEIFPNAVVDAMGAGAAVLVSDAGGMPELVGPTGEAGMVVARDQLQPLVDALETLLADDGLRRRMGLAARERLASHFPLQRMLDDYEDLFRSFARRGHGAG